VEAIFNKEVIYKSIMELRLVSFENMFTTLKVSEDECCRMSPANSSEHRTERIQMLEPFFYEIACYFRGRKIKSMDGLLD
jgi:hypothetical protein